MRGFVCVSLLLILAACAEVKLSAPLDLVVTPGPGLIRLSWQDTDGEEGYTLYRQRVAEEGETAEDFEVLAETDADITSYDDKTAEVGASYLYRVSARANDKESDFAETGEAVSPKPETMVLTLVWRGAGGGEVTSEPAGVSCTPQEGECNFPIATDSQLVLNAQPNASSVFGEWGGACKGTEPSCTLTMDSEKRVEITLNEAKRTLTVKKEGDGAGSVTSPQGLECAANCPEAEAEFVFGNIIALEAVAESGSAFRAWGGACSGQTCSVKLDENKTVTATFVEVPEPTIISFNADSTTILKGQTVLLSWDVEPKQDIRLRLFPGDIEVTDDLSYTVEPSEETTYKLVAETTSGKDEASVTVSVQAAYKLSVARVPTTSSGRVTSSPIGIDCDSDCSEIYPENQVVSLSAQDVISWAGCDEVISLRCKVIMDEDRAVIAYFGE